MFIMGSMILTSVEEDRLNEWKGRVHIEIS